MQLTHWICLQLVSTPEVHRKLEETLSDRTKFLKKAYMKGLKFLGCTLTFDDLVWDDDRDVVENSGAFSSTSPVVERQSLRYRECCASGQNPGSRAKKIFLDKLKVGTI